MITTSPRTGIGWSSLYCLMNRSPSMAALGGKALQFERAAADRPRRPAARRRSWRQAVARPGAVDGRAQRTSMPLSMMAADVSFERFRRGRRKAGMPMRICPPRYASRSKRVDGVAEAFQFACGGESGRAAADDRHALARRSSK